MIGGYITDGIILGLGVALCSRGLKLFKALQMFVCGAIGAYIGLLLQERFNQPWLMYVTIALFLLGFFLGFKYYKVPLCITSSVSTFLVIFSIFWKKAIELYKEGVSDLLDTKDFFWESIRGIKNISEVPAVVTNIFSTEKNSVTTVFTMVAGEVRKGIIISIIAAVIISILVCIMGDLIIEIITAAVGAFLIMNVAYQYVNMQGLTYLVALVVLSVIGIISQRSLNKK